jgi:hypothetical protein
LLLGVLVFLCGLVGAGGYLYFQDPLDLFSTDTLTPTSTLALTDTPQLTATNAESPTVAPSQTQEFTPTVEVLPTQVITPTFPASPTSETIVIFEDDFSGTLNAYWRAWGDPRPKINTGPGDSWLDLTAAEDFGSGGVTSRTEVPSDPGVEILFRGQLNESYPQYELFFDWDPLQYDRGPANKDPGVIHFELRRNQLILLTPLTDEKCEVELDGTGTHTYRIRIFDGQSLELFIDADETLPGCQITNIGLAPVPGTISFTGVGWITHVVVTAN